MSRPALVWVGMMALVALQLCVGAHGASSQRKVLYSRGSAQQEPQDVDGLPPSIANALHGLDDIAYGRDRPVYKDQYAKDQADLTEDKEIVRDKSIQPLLAEANSIEMLANKPAVPISLEEGPHALQFTFDISGDQAKKELQRRVPVQAVRDTKLKMHRVPHMVELEEEPSGPRDEQDRLQADLRHAMEYSTPPPRLRGQTGKDDAIRMEPGHVRLPTMSLDETPQPQSTREQLVAAAGEVKEALKGYSLPQGAAAGTPPVVSADGAGAGGVPEGYVPSGDVSASVEVGPATPFPVAPAKPVPKAKMVDKEEAKPVVSPQPDPYVSPLGDKSVLDSRLRAIEANVTANSAVADGLKAALHAGLNSQRAATSDLLSKLDDTVSEIHEAHRNRTSQKLDQLEKMIERMQTSTDTPSTATDGTVNHEVKVLEKEIGTLGKKIKSVVKGESENEESDGDDAAPDGGGDTDGGDAAEAKPLGPPGAEDESPLTPLVNVMKDTMDTISGKQDNSTEAKSGNNDVNSIEDVIKGSVQAIKSSADAGALHDPALDAESSAGPGLVAGGQPVDGPDPVDGVNIDMIKNATRNAIKNIAANMLGVEGVGENELVHDTDPMVNTTQEAPAPPIVKPPPPPPPAPTKKKCAKKAHKTCGASKHDGNGSGVVKQCGKKPGGGDAVQLDEAPPANATADAAGATAGNGTEAATAAADESDCENNEDPTVDPTPCDDEETLEQKCEQNTENSKEAVEDVAEDGDIRESVEKVIADANNLDSDSDKEDEVGESEDVKELAKDVKNAEEKLQELPKSTVREQDKLDVKRVIEDAAELTKADAASDTSSRKAGDGAAGEDVDVKAEIRAEHDEAKLHADVEKTAHDLGVSDDPPDERHASPAAKSLEAEAAVLDKEDKEDKVDADLAANTPEPPADNVPAGPHPLEAENQRLKEENARLKEALEGKGPPPSSPGDAETPEDKVEERAVEKIITKDAAKMKEAIEERVEKKLGVTSLDEVEGGAAAAQGDLAAAEGAAQAAALQAVGMPSQDVHTQRKKAMGGPLKNFARLNHEIFGWDKAGKLQYVCVVRKP